MYTAIVATIKAMGPASSSLVSDVDAAWTKLKGTQSLADQTKFIIAVKAFISGFKGILPLDAPGRLQLLNMQLNTAADLTAFSGSMNAYKSIGASSGGSLSAPINCVGSWSDCVNGSQTYTVTTAAANWGLACPDVAGATKTCGIPCAGSWSGWGDCDPTSSTQAATYSVVSEASGGGKACPATDGQTKSRACTPGKAAPKEDDEEAPPASTEKSYFEQYGLILGGGCCCCIVLLLIFFFMMKKKA